MGKSVKRKYQKDYTAFSRVMALTELFNGVELAKLLLPIRDSFDALTKGSANAEDVHRLIDTMNVTLVRGWGTDMQPIANAAMNALRRTWERYERIGKFGLDGPGLSEVEQGLELHEELCRLSTPRQMRDAALVVENWRKVA